MSPREHVDQLAEELGVTIHWGSTSRYRAGLDRSTMEVFMPPWEDHPEESYWVALHELGHAADLGPLTVADLVGAGRGLAYGTSRFTQDEAAAWAWAIQHALPEAFPLGQVGESNIAWSITDYMSRHGWEPSPEFEVIYRAVGPDPDWFYDVTTDEHYRKLESWARPMWAELRAVYGKEDS